MIGFLIAAALLAVAFPWFVKYGYRQGWIPELPSFLLETTAVVVLFTIIISVYLYRSQNNAYFVQLYLLTMLVKLVAYCAYLLVIILEDRSGAVANALYFLGIYAIFAALEIGFLYKRIASR